MFGGKKEKALEEALAAAKDAAQKKQETLEQIMGQQDGVLEQFAHMTASRSQMERDLDQVKEHMEHIAVLSENGNRVAGEIHGVMMQINNGVGTFDVNHGVFLEQVKAQNDKVMEIVENNKHFTTPMKYISETMPVLAEEQQKLHERAGRMKEFSKSMSVLSLNSAIEAGRMGETGAKFIAAAEEIRAFSEKYESEARELEEQLVASDAKIAELEEQVRHLNELLKENNISMGKLLKDSMQHTAVYEESQLHLRDLISDTIIGKADALQQSEKECVKVEERMLLQLNDAIDELKDQKESIDELENICKNVVESAKHAVEE